MVLNDPIPVPTNFTHPLSAAPHTTPCTCCCLGVPAGTNHCILDEDRMCTWQDSRKSSICIFTGNDSFSSGGVTLSNYWLHCASTQWIDPIWELQAWLSHERSPWAVHKDCFSPVLFCRILSLWRWLVKDQWYLDPDARPEYHVAWTSRVSQCKRLSENSPELSKKYIFLLYLQKKVKK